jgi:hypothetical protein
LLSLAAKNTLTGSAKNFKQEEVMKKRLGKISLVILFLLPLCANATIISNSIIEDGIEYYIQADKAVYDLGENVEMLFRVTNLRDETVAIPCSRTGPFNLMVQKDQETIWMLAHFFQWDMPVITLSAGESTNIPPYNWNMKDDGGNLIGSGTYNVGGIMYNEPWNNNNHGIPYATSVTVPITVIPEPSSLALFMACLSVLMRNKRVKRI